MVDIFDEVSDDLRTERAIKLARRYGGLLLGACVAVLIVVAGQQTYAWYQQKQDNKAATAYLALTAAVDAAPNATAAQAQKSAAALEQFAATAPEGYKTLSLLRAAALYASAGQPALAASLWNAVAGDTSADPLLRDLANLLWAQQSLGVAPDVDVQARLQPLANMQNPYHGLAQETQALLYLREGHTDLAKALFTQIASDPTAPDGVRNRADGLLAKLNG